MLPFSQERDILQPAAAFFDSLPLLLADFVSGVADGSLSAGDAPAPLGVLCPVRSRFQIPALPTKSLVSYPLSAPKVTRFPPGICASITSAASRSAVPLAWDSSALTSGYGDSPPKDCRCS